MIPSFTPLDEAASSTIIFVLQSETIKMRTLHFLLFSSLVLALASSRTTMGGEKRLIKTSEDKPGTWMTKEEILDLKRNKTNFMDVTYSKIDAVNPVSIKSAERIPQEIRFSETVRGLISNVNMSRVEEFVRSFSSFYNRYFEDPTGRESQLWLLSEVEESILGYAGIGTVSEIDHGDRYPFPFPQQSIVARLEGSDPELQAEVVILGAHLDSMNMQNASGQAPGADDNASGCSVLLETLRLIVASGLRLKRSVEFHWYAGEEGGLLGSLAMSEDYRRGYVDVLGMLNLDIVGYHVDGEDEIGIYTDFAHLRMVQLIIVLTQEYLTFTGRPRTCGYACSDHATWNRMLYPAVFAGEPTFHPEMHTVNDTIDNMSFPQVHEFVKLAVGYVVEMGEPNTP